MYNMNIQNEDSPCDTLSLYIYIEDISYENDLLYENDKNTYWPFDQKWMD
jgi:hypothetical protein